MIQALIGKKIDQTQMFLQNGRRIPVTEIFVEGNQVVQVKTQDKDAYTAVQLGVGVKKKPTKQLAGHSKKSGSAHTLKFLREFRIHDANLELPQIGDMITLDAIFKLGDTISVTGTSKGKGFAGVVKRHHFRGGPKTHGQSDRLRAPGSIGQTTTPGRVYKGKRMAGHMGVEKVTVQNLTVVGIDGTKLLVMGLVPGNKNAILWIHRTGEDKKFIPLLEDEKQTKNEVLEQEEAPQNVEATAAQVQTPGEKPAESASEIPTTPAAEASAEEKTEVATKEEGEEAAK